MTIQIQITRRMKITSFCFFVLYLSLYVTNSITGGYWPSFRLSLDHGPIALYWQPYYGYYVHGARENDLLGYAFWPLIVVDRQFFHFTMGDGIRGSYDRSLHLTPQQIHPSMRHWFVIEMMPYIKETRRTGTTFERDNGPRLFNHSEP